MPNKGWRRHFDDPIPLSRGRQLVTLEDAGNYITKLPKAEHDADEWQAAMEALLLVVDLGGPTMFARIGIMRALGLIYWQHGEAGNSRNELRGSPKRVPGGR